MKIVCPNCQKEISEQAEVQIPTDTSSIDFGAISILVPSRELSGITHGNLVFRDGKYYLVFESIIVCPYCKENFCYDIWLPTTNQP
jgi:uncharacterized protein YbaR (Trm112 family)